MQDTHLIEQVMRYTDTSLPALQDTASAQARQRARETTQRSGALLAKVQKKQRAIKKRMTALELRIVVIQDFITETIAEWEGANAPYANGHAAFNDLLERYVYAVSAQFIDRLDRKVQDRLIQLLLSINKNGSS